MKYWTGYLTALILGLISWALGQLASKYSALVDMIYPAVTRTIQDALAQWSGGVDLCLWQLLLLLMVLCIAAAVVLVVVLHWRPIRLAGWVLAGCSFLMLLNTLMFGLNTHAGTIADDIRLDVYEYTVDELVSAATYYRDEANALAVQMNRDDKGDLEFSDFKTLADQAANGFDAIVKERSFSVLAGTTVPVKKLGWSGIYNAMGVTGITVGLTGEAAVNPKIPDVSLPFTMAREMAHRMCILGEGDAEFAAFLACSANESLEYQYSAYYMAYRYCHEALLNARAKDQAAAVAEGACAELQHDLDAYERFFRKHIKEKAALLVETANNTYQKVNGESKESHAVSDLLVSWHYQEIVLPTITEEAVTFDPKDETQVDLTTTQVAPAAEEETTGE